MTSPNGLIPPGPIPPDLLPWPNPSQPVPIPIPNPIPPSSPPSILVGSPRLSAASVSSLPSTLSMAECCRHPLHCHHHLTVVLLAPFASAWRGRGGHSSLASVREEGVMARGSERGWKRWRMAVFIFLGNVVLVLSLITIKVVGSPLQFTQGRAWTRTAQHGTAVGYCALGRAWASPEANRASTARHGTARVGPAWLDATRSPSCPCCASLAWPDSQLST